MALCQSMRRTSLAPMTPMEQVSSSKLLEILILSSDERNDLSSRIFLS